MYMKVELVSAPGCVHCKEVETILEEIKPDFPALEVEIVEMLTPKGQEMIQKYQIMASPGIVIDGDLFATGGVKKDQLVEKLKSISP